MKQYVTIVVWLITFFWLTACGAAPASESSGQANVGDSPQIMVMDPWSRAAATAGGNGAVYMTLMNEGGSGDKLLGVETDIADVVEIHETTMDENDIAQMRPIEGVELPAGESVALEPGGKHIMLIGLQQDLQAGGTFDLTLNFEQAGPITVEANIHEGGAAMEMDHGQGEMEEAEMNHDQMENMEDMEEEDAESE